MDLQEGKFKRLESSLVGGRYAVTLPGQGMYIPSGWLHAVYTLRSGILTGVTWVNAQSLETITTITLHELKSGSIEAIGELDPFLQALYQAVAAGHQDKWEKTLERVCNWNLRGLKKKPKGESGDVIKRLKGLTESSKGACPKCKKGVLSHLVF